jgi:anti-sigma B factor antagonist
VKFETRNEGRHAVISLIGEITAPDRSAFESAAEEVLATAPRTVVVDMSRLDFMDSAGLGFLLVLLKMAEEKDATVSLSGPRGEVKEQLELARFNLLFPLVD